MMSEELGDNAAVILGGVLEVSSYFLGSNLIPNWD